MASPDDLKQLVIDADAAIDQRVAGLRHHPVVDRVMYAASELGDHSLIWHLIGTAQALRPGRRPASALRVAAVLGAESLLVNGLVKSVFGRHRPVWEDERPRPYRLRTPMTSSFPSGHASSAMAAAGVLAPGDPLAPLYYAVAAVVSSSRVYVKVHHASDVAVGALVGVAIACTVNRVWPSPR